MKEIGRMNAIYIGYVSWGVAGARAREDQGGQLACARQLNGSAKLLRQAVGLMNG